MSFIHRDPSKKTLLYLGGSNGHGLISILTTVNPPFNDVHVFEANKQCYDKLVAVLNPGVNKFIKITYGAVSDDSHKSHITFYNCTDPEGNTLHKDGSSSLGLIDHTWHNDYKQFKMNEVTVPCIYLPRYCEEHNILHIDTYLSDIQGSDLKVLKTMREYLRKKLIINIQCEVTKDGKHNIYKTLPSNEERDFNTLLYPSGYRLVSRGWVCGILKPGEFKEVDPEWWEQDLLWSRVT